MKHLLLMQLAAVTALLGVSENYGEDLYQVADDDGHILFECPIAVKLAYDKLTQAINDAYPEAVAELGIAADEEADTQGAH